MKKLLIVSCLLFVLVLASAFSQNFMGQFTGYKMNQLAKDLEEHNFGSLLNYFDPEHLSSNIDTFMDSFSFTEKEINGVLFNWCFMFRDYGNQCHDVKDIEKVTDVNILEDEVEFTLHLKDGRKVKVISIIDNKTLLLSGASG
ncbi:MAG: hypothetical protein JW969_09615 [Spirochaetales bacterium]|nr:hypothetical protein [Spirochaetales bacterium]